MFYNEGKKEEGSGIHEIAAALAAERARQGAPAESASSQVEPITQGENGAQASEEREESSMVRESGPFTADTP